MLVRGRENCVLGIDKIQDRMMRLRIAKYILNKPCIQSTYLIHTKFELELMDTKVRG